MQIGVIISLIALLYFPFLANAFVSDDLPGIMMHGQDISWFGSIGFPNVIHLGGVLQKFVFTLFSSVPWPYRFMNILFHMGNAVLVWLIVKKLSKSTIALVASLLFAIHPLIIEAVTWISGGVYAQYTFFFLLSFYLYTSVKLVSRYSILAFLFSLFISEKAVPLAGVFVLYEFLFGNLKKNWKRLIPYFLVSIGFILFYISRLGIRLSGLEQANDQTISGLYNPFFQIPIAISSYIELFFWPKTLTLYHSVFQYPWWEMVIRMLVTVGFIVLAFYGVLKKRAFGFWMAWFVLGLGITLLPIKIAWIVAERYVYLSLIGLCVLVGMAFDVLVSYKKWNVFGICFGVAVVFALCARTIIRNNDWRTEDSLWIATAIASPGDPHSWNNMGDVYARHGEYEKSIEAFTNATNINPNYADAYHNIGHTYMQMKRYDEAIPLFEKALSINPHLWQSYQNLAFIAVAQKDSQKAIEYLDKAILINSNDPDLKTMREKIEQKISK